MQSPASNTTLRCLADIKPEQVEFLWYPYIPKGKLTLVEGDPGVGKSWLACALATAVAAGTGPEGWSTHEPSNVLLLSVEDGLGDTIRPRLDSMSADVKRIFALDGAIVFNNSGLLCLEDEVINIKPTLVVVDPLVAYLGARVDLNRANETRAIMARLAQIAEKHGCAILAVRHLKKGGSDRAMYRGIGSIDFAAACRSILLIGCDPENQSKRAVVHIKSNLAAMGEAIGYEIREGKFYWTGKSDLTAEQMLAPNNGNARREVRSEAISFLRELLTVGPILSNDVRQEAQAVGISERTLWRAKHELKVKARKQGNQWLWILPDSESEPDNTKTVNSANPATLITRQDEEIHGRHDRLDRVAINESAQCSDCGDVFEPVDDLELCPACASVQHVYSNVAD